MKVAGVAVLVLLLAAPAFGKGHGGGGHSAVPMCAGCKHKKAQPSCAPNSAAQDCAGSARSKTR